MEGEKIRGTFNSLLHSPHACNNRDWPRPKSEARNAIWISHVHVRDPSTWIIFCLLGHVRRELSRSRAAGTQNKLVTPLCDACVASSGLPQSAASLILFGMLKSTSGMYGGKIGWEGGQFFPQIAEATIGIDGKTEDSWSHSQCCKMHSVLLPFEMSWVPALMATSSSWLSPVG